MRLLSVNADGGFDLTSFESNKAPPYAILSHTWEADNQELTYQDIIGDIGRAKSGYRKLEFCAKQAQQDEIRYFWIDSCCIDRTSSAELQEAITSMFRWYETAIICYVYLADVSTGHNTRPAELLWPSSLRKSRWFTRGWTLQELLAPRLVEFFSKEGERIGDRESLEVHIRRATNIAREALHGRPMSEFSVEERMSWTKSRETSKPEDRAYCLMGIFNVFLPVIYGEGFDSALRRLHESIEAAGKRLKGHGSPFGALLREQAPDCEWCGELVQSLRFDEMDERYRHIQENYGETCKWLLDNHKFRNWHGRDHVSEHRGFFWLKGNPGVGKSTLTKFALTETRRKFPEAVHVSFFYNSRGTDLERDVSGMYRTLISQLLEEMDDPNEVFATLNPRIRRGKLPRWTPKLLKDVLENAVRLLEQKRLFIFIDALDECDTDELNSQIGDMVSFFQTLTDKQASDGNNLHVFFSSRHYPVVTIERGYELRLDRENAHTRDIEIYIESKLATFGRTKWAKGIRTTVLEKAQGVFLWVVLVIPILKKEYDDGDKIAVKKRLNKMPGDLEDLFMRMITGDQRKLDALRICLQWVLFAEYPLSPEELYHAILAGTRALEDWETEDDDDDEEDDDDDESEDEDGEPVDNNGHMRGQRALGQQIGERCASDSESEVSSIARNKAINNSVYRFIVASSKGLAEITHAQPPKVQLIHGSIVEYLLHRGGLELLEIDTGMNHGLSHDCLKKCCENYLNREQLSKLLPGKLEPFSWEDRAHISKKHPFLNYAARNIFHHAELAAENGVSQTDFIKNLRLSRWVHMSNLFESEGGLHTQHVSLAYILAERKYPHLLKNLTEDTARPDEWFASERYRCALYAAIAKGSDACLRILLPLPENLKHEISSFRAMAPFNLGEGRFLDVRPSFSLPAACSGPFLLHLVETERIRIDVSLKDKDGRSPLSYLAEYGHSNLLEKLLATDDPEVDNQDEFGKTAFLYAVANGHKKLAKTLLATEKIDVNAKDASGSTPLSWAASNGHEKLVRLLIEHDLAEFDLENLDGRTPLSWAVTHGHESIVEMLLATGKVRVDKADAQGRTPLWWAAKHRRLQIAKLLLATEDLDANAQGPAGDTPLIMAARNGHTELMQLLLTMKRGEIFNPNIRGHNGMTALSLAALFGHVGVVRLLLAVETIDIDVPNNRGLTALNIAIAEKHSVIVEMLQKKHAAAVGILHKSLKKQTSQPLISTARLKGVPACSTSDVSDQERRLTRSTSF